MTKKHFIALAKVIAETSDERERRRLCEEIGAVCASVSREFRWSTWREACGVER
ncbi:hypothetical protein Ga0061061_11713 [Chelatococcus sambhunathii]|uniref:Uncharacterized protein n=1 Tax=Chelatococcus sambhunathii TaxID=363953 RepID=A0ABP2ADQ9_9HYPH|nr:hypothetical protein Ga0061061_11713 [Chelatococcus sambhunathii]